jgi:hypothetical protein
VRQIQEFKLESFDWSRKGKAGMSANVVALATEMEEGSENDMAELGKVTIAELTEANPNLVTLIRAEGAAAAQTQIDEMEPLKEEAESSRTLFAKLREVLGIDENTDVVQAVADVQEKVENVNSSTLKEKIGEIIAGKVSGERSKSSILRLVNVTEMEGLDDDALKTKVEGLFDTDEDIKAIVSEMEGAPAPLSHRGKDRMTEGGKVGSSGMVRESVSKL